MNKPIHDNQINKVLLKPRFKIEVDESEKDVLSKFKENLKDTDCKFSSKLL